MMDQGSELALAQNKDKAEPKQQTLSPSMNISLAIQEKQLLVALGADMNVALIGLTQVPRYIRLTHLGIGHVSLSSLQEELVAAVETGGGVKGAGCGTDISATPLPDFFALPSHAPIGALPSFSHRYIVGLDLASGIAVQVLMRNLPPPTSPCAVLDLCCAPGGKLQYIAELLNAGCNAVGQRIVTGVDISAERLAQCAAHIRRSQLYNVHLVHGDATTLNPAVPPAHEFSADRAHISCLRRKVATHITDAAARREVWLKAKEEALSKRGAPMCKKRPQSEGSHSSCDLCVEVSNPSVCSTATGDQKQGYCRVMVDAECSSDASIPHLRRTIERQRAGKNCDMLRYMALCQGEPTAADQLETTQRGLIAAGYRALDVGGKLVYVTCSSQKRQNEDIVEWLLQQYPDAQLEDVPTFGVPAIRCGPGGCMARFSPDISGTSGLFIACVMKECDDGRHNGNVLHETLQPMAPSPNPSTCSS